MSNIDTVKQMPQKEIEATAALWYDMTDFKYSLGLEATMVDCLLLLRKLVDESGKPLKTLLRKID